MDSHELLRKLFLLNRGESNDPIIGNDVQEPDGIRLRGETLSRHERSPGAEILQLSPGECVSVENDMVGSDCKRQAGVKGHSRDGSTVGSPGHQGGPDVFRGELVDIKAHDPLAKAGDFHRDPAGKSGFGRLRVEEGGDGRWHSLEEDLGGRVQACQPSIRQDERTRF